MITTRSADGKTIVVPVDGREFSNRAIPSAAAIGAALDAAIRLVGVARNDGELAWMYDHVRSAAGLLPPGTGHSQTVIVDPDPATVLLGLASDPSTVLCVSTHDHLIAGLDIRGSLGSQIMVGSRHPLIVVGPMSDGPAPGGDVVAALDGHQDPRPLLWTAARWALLLDTSVRIVTVYEPVPADVRRPEHFSRSHGPSSNPVTYLDGMRHHVAEAGLDRIELAAIPDPVSVVGGLTDHLAQRPAVLLVAGGQQAGRHVWPGLLRDLVRTVGPPVLVVPRPAPGAASPPTASESTHVGGPS